MDEKFNKTFVATYIGPADKNHAHNSCGKCVLEQYPEHVGVFKYYCDIDSFFLFDEPIKNLNLIEGKSYVMKNKCFLPVDTSSCPRKQYSPSMKGDVCKGGACCQEIVEEYSKPEGPADDQSTTKSIAKSDDKEKMELLLKHGEPETLEDLLSLFLYQYRREFDEVRIKNMIQSIQQDCAVLGIKV